MNFWELFWIVVATFLFFAYLMMLFSIFADIFRDDALGGWGKALWSVFLIFMPFLGALVYLIARGGSMAERSMRQAQEYQAAQADYIRTVAEQRHEYLPDRPGRPGQGVARLRRHHGRRVRGAEGQSTGLTKVTVGPA